MIDFDYFKKCCEQHLEHLRVLDTLSCSNEEDSDTLGEIIDIVRHSFFQSFKLVSDQYFFPLTNVPNHPEWCSEFLFDNNTNTL